MILIKMAAAFRFSTLAKKTIFLACSETKSLQTFTTMQYWKQTSGFEYAYNNSLGSPVITMKSDTGDTKEQGSAELLDTISNLNTAEKISI